MSTESGIPDYRSPGRPPHKPVSYNDIVSSDNVRRRFWARSLFGYPRLSRAVPNSGHTYLAELESIGRCAGVVTQNVDGLHQRGGSRSVVELHGNAHSVTCIMCGWQERRDIVHATLKAANRAWLESLPPSGDSVESMPDGDAALSPVSLAAFELPICEGCGSTMLVPTVVFYGGTVDPAVAAAAAHMVDSSDALVVLGTTLSTQSALRLVRSAHQRSCPVAIINHGVTRGDPLATVTLDVYASTVLRAWATEARASSAYGTR